jgi:hypothetical protein
MHHILYGCYDASVDVAYFTRVEAPHPVDGSPVAGSRLRPEQAAASLWGGGAQMRGSAVSGALAREAERVTAEHGAAQLLPVRWTLDLYRPAAMRECTVSGRVVRAGKRLCLVDVVLRQSDGDRELEVARASALFLARRPTAPGSVWTAPLPVELPPADLQPGTTESRLYFSEGVGWTGSPQPHQNARRKRVWLFGLPVVRGESPSPFQLTAAAGDVANFVANWGADGIAFINADAGVALARLPEGSEIGVAAELRIEHEGLVSAVTTLFDRQGVFGTSTVSALLSPGGAIDPRQLGDPLPREGSRG